MLNEIAYLIFTLGALICHAGAEGSHSGRGQQLDCAAPSSEANLADEADSDHPLKYLIVSRRRSHSLACDLTRRGRLRWSSCL
jgi:hypothetical protein